MTDTAGAAEVVNIVRSASDRARYSLYVAIVATILILAANYNAHQAGWPVTRLHTWYQAIKVLEKNPSADVGLSYNDPEEIRRLRNAYLKEFASRALFTSSPIPGVSIDVNNLGFFGGVALVLLMIVTAASFSAEHESIYLALDRVATIATDETVEASARQQNADFLYHALVTAQILNAPPTRARWKRPYALSLFRTVFLAPPLVYAWVMWTEWSERQITSAYGVDIRRALLVEACMLAGIAVLSTLTWLHSRAIAVRWCDAFFIVNPDRREATQQSLREWLRMGRHSKPPTA